MASKNKDNNHYLLLFCSGCIFGILAAALVWKDAWLEQDRAEILTRTISQPNWSPAQEKLNNYTEFQTSLRLNQSKNVYDVLRKKVRILCWVMTMPKNYINKAPFTAKTWGRHCDKFLFVSDTYGEGLWEVYSANISIRGREGLWLKVQEAFRYIHKNHRGEYDWVLKADDDTYMNMDSLREKLSPLDASESLWLGEQWNKVRGTYAAPSFEVGGAGYVFSWKAVDILVQKLEDNGTYARLGCDINKHTSEEELMLSDCLEGLVKLVDTRDEHGVNTFNQYSMPEMMTEHRFPPFTILMNNRFQYWESTFGINKSCCSSYATSFHYISGYKMFVFEYLIRKVNPFDSGNLLATNKPT